MRPLPLMPQVMSYCTRFDGSFTNAKGRQQTVDVGSKYRVRVAMVGPVSLADAAKQMSPRREEVSGRCLSLCQI